MSTNIYLMVDFVGSVKLYKLCRENVTLLNAAMSVKQQRRRDMTDVREKILFDS